MSLRTLIETEATPRGEAVVDKISNRIISPLKIAGLGAFWFLTVGQVSALIVMYGLLALVRAVGTHQGDSVEPLVIYGGLAVTQLALWLLFYVRIRRLRGGARLVARDAKLVDGTIVNWMPMWGGRSYNWEFPLDGTTYYGYGGLLGNQKLLEKGQAVKILAAPYATYGLIFIGDDEGLPIRVRGIRKPA
ncbi:MAG TPA: hypothetical protein VGM90_17550 [Kofleriaceae bacterium]